jgi:hypothetical protein
MPSLPTQIEGVASCDQGNDQSGAEKFSLDPSAKICPVCGRDDIALFELVLEQDRVRVVKERHCHYRLVPHS